ncbi:MAG: glycosyltransferase family 2 protein [Candidatus Brocadiaceae bacterium]
MHHDQCIGPNGNEITAGRQNVPKVSIIIPAYNSERYIRETIDSVFNQTYKDFEIIVIDDGSFDNTKEVLKTYEDTIRYYYQENGGVTNARLHGLNVARGEYIALVDADDIWLPEKLKIQVEFLDSCTDIGLVFSNFHDFYERGFDRRTFFDQNIIFRKIPVKSISEAHPECKVFAKANILYEYLLGNFILPSTLIVRKTIAVKFKMFEKKFDGREIYEFGTRSFHQIKLGFVDKVLIHRRFHGTNVTFNSELICKRTIEICPNAINYPWMDKKCKKILKKELLNAYFRLGKYYFIKGRLEEALNSFKLAFQKQHVHTRVLVFFYFILFLSQEITFKSKIMLKNILTAPSNKKGVM